MLSLSRLAFSLFVYSVGGCSLLFGILSKQNECDPAIFPNRCDEDVSVLCENGRIILVDCSEGNTFCDEETKECAQLCGNGFVESGEDCDPGLNQDGERDENCNLVCQKIDGCGDGIRSATEDCDDGNNTSSDGCSDVCRFEPVSELLFDRAFSLMQTPPDPDPAITEDIVIRGSLLRRGVLPTLIPSDDTDIFRLENSSDQPIEVRADVLDPRRGNRSCGVTPEFPNIAMSLSGFNSDGVSLGVNARRSLRDACPSFFLTIPPNDFVTLSIFITEQFFNGPLQSEYLLVIDFEGESVCGDGTVQTVEQCENSNSDICDLECQLVPFCGNSLIENILANEGAGEIIYEENCDDGNQTPGDGCDETCHREDAINEQEPNGGATPSPNADELLGNDFTTQGLQRITSSGLVAGLLDPAGDEDIFELQNTEDTPRIIRVEAHNPDGAPCSANFNALINIRDAAGALRLYGGFKAALPSMIDACSLVELVLQPQELVYVQVLKYGDNRRSLNYLLQVDFSDCGNNNIEAATEECDDGNNISGDGCVQCQREPRCGDGLVDAPEQCDDGNITSNDGCDSFCQQEDTLITEVEVPDDPNPIAAINGQTSHSTIFSGLLDGRETYALINETDETTEIFFSVWDAASGVGTPCDEDISPIDVRVLDLNITDVLPPLPFVRCPSASFLLGPRQVLFVSMENATPDFDYLLQVRFVRCGDGVVEGSEECDAPDGVSCDQRCQRIQTCGDSLVDAPEECDDGNIQSGDGCDECRLEGFASLIEQVESPTAPILIEQNTLLRGLIRIGIPFFGSIDEDVLSVTNNTDQFALAHIEILSPRAGGRSPCLTLGVFSSALLGVNEDGCRTLLIPLQPGESESVFLSVGNVPPPLEGIFYTAKVEFSSCGDGRVSPGEECEPANSATCDEKCQRIASCGDGLVDLPELCDDGNTADNDACPSDCAAINFAIESEPNDDGTPNTNASLFGNDFSAANADGPFTQDILISAAIAQSGDEDVFLVQNPLSAPVRVRADTFNPLLGFSACGNTIDTVLNIRDSSGALLAQNDNRDTQLDTCSGLEIALPPSGVAFVHALEFTDLNANAGYLLQLDFTPIICGDGLVEAFELCDDQNTNSGDGCSSGCVPEANFVCQGEPSQCRPIVCGDGFTDFPESCDDGNINNGDSCDADCEPFITVQESEPNDDGAPSSTLGLNGGDFSAAAADGPFVSAAVIEASISPLGDEDIFLFTNTEATQASLRLDTFDPALGVGASCVFIDTVLNLKDNNGNLILQNDERVSGDHCSGLAIILDPGESVFAQVLAFNDNSVISSYLPQASLTPIVCGDGLLVNGEQCDDGNIIDDDGCSSTCQVEGFGLDCPANQTLLQIASTDVPKNIPDNDPAGVQSVVNVVDNRSVQRVMVQVGNLTHTFDSDLEITLISPANTEALLFDNHGSNGDNLIDTIFDDSCIAANGSIASGFEPFTGCFSPSNPLSVFNNQSANGQWKLKIADLVNFDTGTLNAWTLNLCVQ
jgi:cysteine-rich repeat protein